MFKKLLLSTAIFVFVFSISAQAQFEIGASYELRNDDPKNGFGFRVQKGILQGIPLVDLGLRLHFSYFNEGNSLTKDGITYSEITNYDYGLAAYGGVSLGLLQPYLGVGIGSESADFESASTAASDWDESNFYWNTFAGAKVTVIPLIKPFVEFRYSNKELSKPTLADAQNSRFIVGVLLSF